LNRRTGTKKVASHQQGKVTVVDLGFVNDMAEYMVAADVLVSKAGPGTIAEAAAVGLPVMLSR
jgi:1,2-diacylglycerol 3-beta-galactosyltransferase